ncbi:Peptidyl-glycine alpha-amidating monooxygenase A [Trichinella pseudospiralis]|uniref:Peptidyl-glycine alpha-amidating monooxygenase A n=2 Tax=Trichinella pseudospiralis TaxID=6337 RepID=A0A0V1DZ55_TRIPS|nr:Peptidyl-glycine alpha-amidating monooxygenase A [Trichinella pseudospiralis]
MVEYWTSRFCRLLFFCLLVFGSIHALNGVYELDLKMPGKMPSKDEEYLCYGIKVEQPGYITEFIPIAEVSRVHHMIVFGAMINDNAPGSVWRCEGSLGVPSAKILYAWARNAPALKMPNGVGVPISGSSTVNYLILQMHYNLKFIGSVLDYSGVTMKVTSNHPNYVAGVYILYADGSVSIPPKISEFPMNISCAVEENVIIHPFAYRTHAHSLGRIITGYKYRGNKWTLIGKGNPQWPQWFYPVKDKITITRGDTIAAQCIFDSTSRRNTTKIGAHGMDEMCNFYMYYFVELKHLDVLEDFSSCGSSADESLFSQYPADANKPLPPNPVFERQAKMVAERFGPELIDDWLQSLDVAIGQISGIAIDADDNVLIFHRGPRIWDEQSFDLDNMYLQQDKGPIRNDTVLVISPTGKLLKRWGGGLFYMPHGIFVDHKKKLWLTDVALHQVFRFDFESSMEELILGKRFIPGGNLESFCKPAAVAVSKDDLVFVADGYCNSRVMKFSYDGKFLQVIDLYSIQGHRNAFDYMQVVHSLAINDEKQELLVTDRENSRLVIFKFNGTLSGFIKEKHMHGAIYGITYCPKMNVFYVINNQLARETVAPVEIRVFAFESESYRLLYSFKPDNFDFKNTHSIACSLNCSNIYISHGLPNTLLKFNIHAISSPVHVEENADNANLLMESSNELSMFDSHTFYTTIILCMVAAIILAMAVAAVMVGCRVLHRRQGSSSNKDRSNHPLLKNSKWRQGFQPLSTEDIDAVDYTSDDSDDREDLLYSSSQMKKTSDL